MNKTIIIFQIGLIISGMIIVSYYGNYYAKKYFDSPLTKCMRMCSNFNLTWFGLTNYEKEYMNCICANEDGELLEYLIR